MSSWLSPSLVTFSPIYIIHIIFGDRKVWSAQAADSAESKAVEAGRHAPRWWQDTTVNTLPFFNSSTSSLWWSLTPCVCAIWFSSTDNTLPFSTRPHHSLFLNNTCLQSTIVVDKFSILKIRSTEKNLVSSDNGSSELPNEEEFVGLNLFSSSGSSHVDTVRYMDLYQSLIHALVLAWI